MNVRIGGLDGSEERIFLPLVYLVCAQEPEDVRTWQSFYLALQVELLPLLPAGGFPEEGGLNPSFTGGILVLHRQPHMVSLLSVLVTNIDHVVTSILVRKMPGHYFRFYQKSPPP